MPMELELLKALQQKPQDMTLNGFFELFAKRNNMNKGQVHSLYYNSVRNDYEKWKSSQEFQKKPKPEPKKEPEKKISQYDIAKAVKTYQEEGPAEIPMQAGRIMDPNMLKMRIAFLESRMKTLKDPFQLLIVEPWLAELKEELKN